MGVLSGGQQHANCFVECFKNVKQHALTKSSTNWRLYLEGLWLQDFAKAHSAIVNCFWCVTHDLLSATTPGSKSDFVWKLYGTRSLSISGVQTTARGSNPSPTTFCLLCKNNIFTKKIVALVTCNIPGNSHIT